MSTWSGGRELGCDAVCCCRRMLNFCCLKAPKVPSLDTLPKCFFFCTSDGFRPQTSGWYVDAKTLGLSGAAYKLDACSIQGAVAVVDERCLDGKESRRIWATFLRVEKKQNVGRTFARKPTFLPEIKSWATFCGTFSPIKSCQTKCCPKINILVKDYASINMGVTLS